MSAEENDADVNSSSGRKARSPDAPSRSLGDCVDDVEKAYDQYSHGTFSRQELASTLEMSATSGTFGKRLFTLKAFGLLDTEGENFKASDLFKSLLASPKEGSAFKTAALAAFRRPRIFNELMEKFPSKLPPRETIATRLELSKGFVKERAVAVATHYEESLRYVGVVDGNNNILPIRDSAAAAGTDRSPQGVTGANNDSRGGLEKSSAPMQIGQRPDSDLLTIEIAVADGRKVIVNYPPNLTESEAAKVGKVLAALTS